jgi:hypothetical protein
MKRFVTLFVVSVALLAPAGALAVSSSTCQAYSQQVCAVQSSSNDAADTTTTSQSTLPFTGLDVVLLVVGGGTLLGAGLVVRVLSRRLN